MKLTEEQIKEVETYLTKKGVKYIDLRFEILDHISTDIENSMNKKQLDFNETFEKVKENWNEAFSYKWTYWLGISNGDSKLFIDYCLKIYKPLLFKIIVGIIAFLAIFFGTVMFFKIDLNEHFLIIKPIFISILLSYPMILIYWRFKLKETNLESVYSYLYLKQIFPNLYIIPLFIFQIFKSTSLSNFSFVYLIVFLSFLIMAFNFYKNHIKAVSNYKKYQLK